MGWDRITDPVPAIFFENTDRAGLTRSVRVLDHPVAYPVERTFRPRTDTRTHACCWSLHFCVVALTGAALGVRPGSVDVVATLAGSGVGLAHDAASTHGITTIGDACYDGRHLTWQTLPANTNPDSRAKPTLRKDVIFSVRRFRTSRWPCASFLFIKKRRKEVNK